MPKKLTGPLVAVLCLLLVVMAGIYFTRSSRPRPSVQIPSRSNFSSLDKWKEAVDAIVVDGLLEEVYSDPSTRARAKAGKLSSDELVELGTWIGDNCVDSDPIILMRNPGSLHNMLDRPSFRKWRGFVRILAIHQGLPPDPKVNAYQLATDILIER